MKIPGFAVLAASLVVASLPAVAAETRGWPARCVITNVGTPAWRGPCLFAPEGRDGSFTVTPRNGAFPDGVGAISVGVTRPGLADVRGLSSQGVNSRWGPARRSARDRACWVGEDFSVCVY